MTRSSIWYSQAKKAKSEEFKQKVKLHRESSGLRDERSKKQDDMKGPGKSQRQSNIDPARTLYISDCPYNVTDEEVHKYYKLLGKKGVEFIRWEKNKFHREGCTGWIVFRTKEMANWAMKMDPPKLGWPPRIAQLQWYNEAPSRKRVSAILEESKAKHQRLEGVDAKKALATGQVLVSVQWTPQQLAKRPFQKDFSHLITYKARLEGEETELLEVDGIKDAVAEEPAKNNPSDEPSGGQEPDEDDEENEGKEEEAEEEVEEDSEEETEKEEDEEEEDEEDSDDSESDSDQESVGSVYEGKKINCKFGSVVIEKLSEPQEDLDWEAKARQKEKERRDLKAQRIRHMRELEQKKKKHLKLEAIEDAKRKMPMKAADHVKTEGDEVPQSIWTFDEINFGENTNLVLQKRFVRPSPIQCYSWPVILHGRDMIGLADTGSGKTMAYILPALVHWRAQSPPKPGNGPVVLILAPARELVLQIATEVERFRESDKVRVGVAYGGMDGKGSRLEQGDTISQGIDMLVATPGRLIDFVEADLCRLFRVTYLVVDEADHMLDLGFAPQLKNLLSQIRPDRQTLMFSATWQKEVRMLAKEMLNSPIKVVINHADELKANKSVKQEVILFRKQEDKEAELIQVLKRLTKGTSNISRTLIFVNRKKTADDLLKVLKKEGYGTALALHGDLTQGKREKVLERLRLDPNAIAVGTDVAARGIDIRNLACVINYDLPRAIDQYIHRIGRTGRAGNEGLAISFFLEGVDRLLARKLVRVIREAKQEPPRGLCLQMHKSRTETGSSKKAERQLRAVQRKQNAYLQNLKNKRKSHPSSK